jgi:hypothetical protein
MILAWCELFDVMMCVSFEMLACLYRYYLPTLDSSDTKCTKEGEVFEYQEEEDQGQADQGKPSKLVACLIPVLVIA